MEICNDDCHCAKCCEDSDEIYEDIPGEMFMYGLPNKSTDTFSQDQFLVFTLTLDCWCWEDLDMLYNTRLYAYVNRKDHDITYLEIFNAIDTQISKQLKELEIKYGIILTGSIPGEDIMCDHRFIEVFSKRTNIEYNILCGS